MARNAHDFSHALVVTGLAAFAIQASGIASAAPTTIAGTDFTVTYDPALIDPLFGPLSVSGNTIYFTPIRFKAQAENGQGIATGNGTANGIVITRTSDRVFENIDLTETGDFRMLVSSLNFVVVTGELRAFDLASPTPTQTAVPIKQISGANMGDSFSAPFAEAWAAQARITDATFSGVGQFTKKGTAWLAHANAVVVTIENLLTAYAGPFGNVLSTGVTEHFPLTQGQGSLSQIETKYLALDIEFRPSHVIAKPQPGLGENGGKAP